ncbi:hypothetical protein MEQU1_003604 [Malassezia equina]|uniref:Maintenance of telomere capping protein 1 n=1 Tax=Malassezia equina TaxID=1381935 RepID=A0AAF0EG40_9BASI|nr:hypothetical protein MEQU1_003604 [Malassezia equina]
MTEETKTSATNASPRKQDVDALLADLSLDMKASELPKKTAASRPRLGEKPSPSARPHEAQSLLDDLEGMVQRRRHTQRDSKEVPHSMNPPQSRPATGALRPLKMEAQATSAQHASVPPKAVNQAPVTETHTHGMEAAQETSVSNSEPLAAESDASENKAWGAWGSGAPWGHLFSTATKFAGQAREEIGRRTAAIVQTGTGEKGMSADQQIYDLGTKMAQRVRGLVHDAHLDQLGQNLSEVGRKGWHDILNAVVLPVEAHDSVNVTVSHADLDITVKLDEASAHTKSTDVYDLNVARTRADGIQNARAHLRRIMEETLKGSEMSEEGMVLTSLTCPVLLRIQPFFDNALPDGQEDLFAPENEEEAGETEAQNKQQLHFLVICPSRTKSVGGTGFE